jgi:hypothetical protein
MCHIINTDAVKSLYFAHFHSTVKYGIIFWGHSFNSKKILTLQKTTARSMAGFKPKNSCTSLLKRLEIVTLSCEYTFSLLLFTVNNQEYFQTNSTVHSVNTRNKNQLHVFKYVYYAGIRIFNSLPSSITSLIHKKKQFKVALKRYLIIHSLYSVDEFVMSSD